MSNGSILSAVPFVCPLDALPLMTAGRSLVCSRRHCFDVAAAGHVNLLPVQFKASRDPGDSKSMVQARRRVMDTNFFQPVAKAFSEVARQHLSPKSTTNQLIVDVGCGEGYFTSQLASHLAGSNEETNPIVFGLDVSKWAVAAAAARYDDIAWAVASGKSLPLRIGTPIMITSLFGFQFWEHWSQMQDSDGLVVVVDAGKEHLIELRALIYPSLRVRDAPAHEEALASGYTLVETAHARYNEPVIGATIIADILEMTPHGHKITAEGRSAVAEITKLDLTVDTVIRVYKRS